MSLNLQRIQIIFIITPISMISYVDCENIAS
jgi:hypothetical protein